MARTLGAYQLHAVMSLETFFGPHRRDRFSSVTGSMRVVGIIPRLVLIVDSVDRNA